MNDGAFAEQAAKRRHSEDQAEIAELRQRLAFYEGFDRIIQENVARSGDLLRLAAERQAEADRAAALARQELDAETRRHRAVLAQLLVDVGVLRSSLDAVERRLATSLEPDQLGGETAGNDRAPLGGSATRKSIGLSLGDGIDTADLAAAVGRFAADARSGSSPDEPTSVQDQAGESAATISLDAAPGEAGPTASRCTLVVHGLGDVASARSLVEHLRGRAGITSVDPREFAGGVLRLEVDGLRPIRADDVESWDRGQVEVADEGREMLVLRLPTAPTL